MTASTDIGVRLGDDPGIHYARENMTSAEWRWDSRVNGWSGWLLWYIRQGSGTISYPGANGASYDIGPGSCCCFAMQEHFIGTNDEPLQILAIGFHAHHDDALWPGFRRHRRMRQDRHLTDCMRASISAWNQQDTPTANHWLRSALMLVASEDAQPVLSGRDQMRARQVSELAEEMRQNPAGNWSSSDVVARLGVGREQAIRLFKRYHGTSPGDWLLHCRIEEAMHLLRFSDLLIKDIAAAVGFQDSYYFSRAFKKIQGCSPKAWRQLPWEQDAGNVGA